MANERKQTDISIRDLVTKLYSEGKSFLKVWEVVGRTHSKYTKIHKEMSEEEHEEFPSENKCAKYMEKNLH